MSRIENAAQHTLLGLLVAAITSAAYLVASRFDPLAQALMLGWFANVIFWVGHESADYARTIRVRPNQWRHWWLIFDVRYWHRDQQNDLTDPAIGVAVALLFGYIAARMVF